MWNLSRSQGPGYLWARPHMVSVPPHPPSFLGLRFSLVNDSEGWLCIKEVSGEVHTARPLQGAQPGDMYTVLVEVQDAGMARQQWGPLGGRQTSDRQMERQDQAASPGPLPTSTLPQSGAGNEGLGPVSLSENAWSSPQTTLVARHCLLAPEGLSGCWF